MAYIVPVCLASDPFTGLGLALGHGMCHVVCPAGWPSNPFTGPGLVHGHKVNWASSMHVAAACWVADGDSVEAGVRPLPVGQL